MNIHRKRQALKIRNTAAELAFNRHHPSHVANGDEQKFRRVVKDECTGESKSQPSYLASYSKGLPHDPETGLVNYPSDFQRFVTAIDSGDTRDFADTRLGPINAQPLKCGDKIKWEGVKAKKLKAKVRAWESQGAGHSYDLEGPDAQAVTMPPAPTLGSDELTAEMAEVYAQAVLRDVEFTQFSCSEQITGEANESVSDIICKLNELDWFKDTDCCTLTSAERSRKRGNFTRQCVFRGITPGDDVGPYISQFLLAGNGGINGNDKEPLNGGARTSKDGLISYGAVNIDQRVRFAESETDYMTEWNDWLDVQNGADLRGQENYVSNEPARRFITTPRDLATYVHYDALYEAYLNACLILMGHGVPFDPGIPFQGSDVQDHQQGFAHFGGPHILSLVTEVATRALKAVRFQKFNVHRRLRPEALAARIEKANVLQGMAPELLDMAKELEPITNAIKTKNNNVLLPMAFCEGSPMHPSYGAGHATVAGACVTILKAFFDHKYPLDLAVKGDASKAFVARYDKTSHASTLEVEDVVEEVEVRAKGRVRPIHSNDKWWWAVDHSKLECRKAELTVEGELNKLASNISIGRDWAGVHYFSDYIESLRMGEQIAIGILEEQKLTYGENFSMTVPLYDGGSIRI